MEEIIFDRFGDNDTAFIVTADHGMTAWGSHGAGSDDEILARVRTVAKAQKIEFLSISNRAENFRIS